MRLSVDLSIILLMVVWTIGLPNLGYLMGAWLFRLPLTEFTMGDGPTLAKFTIGITRFELKATMISSGWGLERVNRVAPWRMFAYLMSAPVVALLLGGGLFYGWMLMEGMEPFRPGANIVYVQSPKETSSPLRAEDVVTAAAGQPIRDGLDLALVLVRWKSGPLELSIERDGKPQTIALQRDDQAEERTHIICSNERAEEHLGPLDALLALPGIFADSVRGYFWYIQEWISPKDIRRTTAFNYHLIDSPEPGTMYVLTIAMWATLVGVCCLIPLPYFGGPRRLNCLVLAVNGEEMSDRAWKLLNQFGWFVLTFIGVWLVWQFFRPSLGTLELYRPFIITARWSVNV